MSPWLCDRCWGFEESRNPSANGDDGVGYMSLVHLTDLERMLAAGIQYGWL